LPGCRHESRYATQYLPHALPGVNVFPAVKGYLRRQSSINSRMRAKGVGADKNAVSNTDIEVERLVAAKSAGTAS